MVSVIVPCYNHASFLIKRVESILNQTFIDFELILLDDYSTDASVEILKSYKFHPKVSHIILNKENSGSPFKQWQKGLALAKGEYIWIAESDDYADINFLENLTPILRNNTEVGLVYCNSYIVDERNHKKGSLVRDTRLINKSEVTINAGIEELKQRLINSCSIMNVSSVIFKKEALVKIINNIVHFKYAGDWLAYILISFNWDIAYVPKTLNYFRAHKKNTTLSSSYQYKNTVERLLVKLESIYYYNLNSFYFQEIKDEMLKSIKLELNVLRGGVLRFKYSPIQYFKFIQQYKRIK